MTYYMIMSFYFIIWNSN